MSCGTSVLERSVTGAVEVGHTEKVACDLRQIAFTEARRVGLTIEEADDCAMDLVLHALQPLQPLQQPEQENAALGSADSPVSASILTSSLLLRCALSAEQRAAWLRRCARNFARNYRRNQSVREKHEAASGDPRYNGSYKTGVASAEAEALMRLFRQDAYAAAHALPLVARAAFARFHFQEDSIVEIAFSSGKSESAVKQQLYRSRHQVRTTLAEQGHRPNELSASL